MFADSGTGATRYIALSCQEDARNCPSSRDRSRVVVIWQVIGRRDTGREAVPMTEPAWPAVNDN
jgi:hypothetical protein